MDEAERRAWQQRIAAIGSDRFVWFVWLDECGVSTRLLPRRGWGPRGQRVVETAPWGRWDTISLLATMDGQGMTASVVVPGAVGRRVFDQFVAEMLVPKVRPGQIVMLDDLSVHRSARAEAALAAVGCELWFLPRHSPDGTPIEQAFSKLMARLRRRQARTFEAVVEAIDAGYRTITAQDATSFIRSAGSSS